MSRDGLWRVLRFLGTLFLLWGIYALAVSYFLAWIFWVYVALFGVGAILYVVLTRGNLTDPPATPLGGTATPAYLAARDEIIALRRRYAFLPPIIVGSLLCLLLDYINLIWFNGIFL